MNMAGEGDRGGRTAVCTKGPYSNGHFQSCMHTMICIVCEVSTQTVYNFGMQYLLTKMFRLLELHILSITPPDKVFRGLILAEQT